MCYTKTDPPPPYHAALCCDHNVNSLLEIFVNCIQSQCEKSITKLHHSEKR